MKAFLDKLICKLFGHKPDRIDHRGICSDYICVRCWYYHEGIKWPDPPNKSLPKHYIELEKELNK